MFTPFYLADPYAFAASILAIAIERLYLYFFFHVLRTVTGGCDYAEGYRDLNDHKLEHPVDAIVRQYTVSVLDQIARRVRNQDRSTASLHEIP